MKLKVKKLHKDAKIPSYANVDDAGMDLYAIKGYKIKPKELKLVNTGIAVELPPQCVGLIWDKSGVAMKFGIKTLGGVLDEGYRGEITVGLFNLLNKTYTIDKGDKIAQMLVQKVERAKISEVKQLSSSVRGAKRFGSSGRK